MKVDAIWFFEDGQVWFRRGPGNLRQYRPVGKTMGWFMAVLQALAGECGWTALRDGDGALWVYKEGVK